MADGKAGITLKDAEAFAAKVQAWSQTLDAKERAFLHVLLKSAEAGGPARSELSDQALEGVAGGGSSPNLGGLALNVFSRFVGPGGLAAGDRTAFRQR